MMCRIKFNCKSNINDNLLHAFNASSSNDMKLSLDNIFNSSGVPEEYRIINNSADGKYFWDTELIFSESITRTPRTLTVDFNCSSSFNENELCSSLKKLSSYLGDISVLFWHEDDPTMTSGWHKYHKGEGELYGTKRVIDSESSNSGDPYLDLYFEQRERTILVIKLLQQYINDEIIEAENHLDTHALEKLNRYAEDLALRVDRCDFNIPYLEELRNNLDIIFTQSNAPNLASASEELEDIFYSPLAAVRKYIFREKQVKSYGLMSDSGEILTHQ